MKLFVPKELLAEETRVALAPATVTGLKKKGIEVAVEKAAGASCGWNDEDYQAQGAETVEAAAGWGNADMVFKVAPPTAANGIDEWRALRGSTILVGMLEPALVKERARTTEATLFSLELLPRITRAQAMDALSSQNNLAGYAAVIRAAFLSDGVLPLMMTAAGTVTAAKVLVVGVGVAGLQAIATARRLGAVVSAFDARPETAEQVASLGAKFISIEGGNSEPSVYAEEMGEDYKKRQAEALKRVLPKQDIVITTALIPGKKAPLIITEEMLGLMPNGSVVVDCAARQGGNCEVSKLGETVRSHGVIVDGPVNLARKVAPSASTLYARNLSAFADLLLKDGKPAINREDEIVKATCIAHRGKWMPFATQ